MTGSDEVEATAPKIGVVTIFDNGNYGNRLQNLAVHEIIRSVGGEARTLVPPPSPPARRSMVGLLKRFGEVRTRGAIAALSTRWRRRRTAGLDESRRSRISEFTRQTIDIYHLMDWRSDSGDAAAWVDDFQCFVVGSDQVWNPHWLSDPDFFFLRFAPPPKRVSLSASFGVSEIPPSSAGVFGEGLKGLQHLSVREEAAIGIVAKLAGREASVLVDPTLALPAEFWQGIARGHRNSPDNPYLVTYLLGGESSETAAAIEQVAFERGLGIVRLADRSAVPYYDADPAEFLAFILESDLVVTDSFHALVFSLLFDKEALVVERQNIEESLSSRIESLISVLGLTTSQASDFYAAHQRIVADQADLEAALIRERSKMTSFLRSAIRGV